MKYRFYYDETSHSRLINQDTITAENYYDNFITVIVGWDQSKEKEIADRYASFEEKYAYRKKKGELKSTTLDQKKFGYGFAALNNEYLSFIDDFLSFFDQDVYLYFSVESKIEYVVSQLLINYEGGPFVDVDLVKYSLVKALHTYKPANVFDSLYNHPEDLVNQIKLFLRDRIKRNQANLKLKEHENLAFIQISELLDEIDEPITLKWDYHMPFEGFRLFLEELDIPKYSLIIDREGDKQGTLKAALDMGHISSEEADSKEYFGIRMADLLAGIISILMKSLSSAVWSDYTDMKKVILDKRWFDLQENKHALYKKLRHVLLGINDCWYKSYASIYADDLILLIALLNYLDSRQVDELAKALEKQGEYFNSYSLMCLEDYYKRIHNPKPVEVKSVGDVEYITNHWGTKVYVDVGKQPMLKIPNGQRMCLVLSVGIHRNGVPMATINDDGIIKCCRLPDDLVEWVEMVLGFSYTGMSVLPAYVTFTKKNGKVIAYVH